MDKLEYVIRTVGERTEEVCIELVRSQKEAMEQVTVLKENTHVGAVEKTFQVGLNSEADWLVAIDADMLLLPDGIAKIRNEISACNKNVFVAFPAVYDKLYSMRRWGVTVYRISMIEELYQVFSEIKNLHHLKIEGRAIKEMAKGSLEIFQSKKVVALHDFYQYHRDLYRKVYLNTIRNPGYNKIAIIYWNKMASKDADYLVMLKSMGKALVEQRELTNSVNDFSKAELEERLQSIGIKEKKPFSWDDYKQECLAVPVDKMIRSNKKNSMFNDFFDDRSIIDKCKAFILKALPASIHDRYLSIKGKAIEKD